MPETVVLMTGKTGSPTLQSRSGQLVDGLARSVISKVSATPHQRRHRRIEIGVKILYAAATDNATFDRDQVEADLAALRISRTDIIDQCIPHVASALGEDWVTDRLSFAAVTSAAARLFGLCKSLGQDWDNIRPGTHARSILLVTLDREHHILGPAVLADQLRRRGHSVQLHSNASATTIQEKLAHDRFDGILISVSTWQALETAAKAIRKIKDNNKTAFIVLGGAALNEKEFDVSTTDADMTTNDINLALDAMSSDKIELKVAE